jgi:hypothetical protein
MQTTKKMCTRLTRRFFTEVHLVATKLVPVVVMYPLNGSRANWLSRVKPSAGAAHPLLRWGSSKPRALLELLFAIPTGRAQCPSQSFFGASHNLLASFDGFYVSICKQIFQVFLGVSYVCLQVFHLHVAYAYNNFQMFSGVFASVSDTCFKCFIRLLLYVATIAFGCFKSKSGVAHGMRVGSVRRRERRRGGVGDVGTVWDHYWCAPSQVQRARRSFAPRC